MGTFGLIFKQKVRFGVNASDEFLPFGAVELDASIDETHRSANEITQFPVEVGVDISDHIRRQPETLSIRGIVTDHPISFGGTFGVSGRSLEAYQNVLTMIDQAQLISVVTSLRQYANMAIESMEVPRNNRRSNAVEMILNLREVLTAQVAETAGTTDLGTQTATPV